MKRLLSLLIVTCAAFTSLVISGCAKDNITPHLVYPQSHGDKGVTVIQMDATREGGILTVQAELKNENSSNARAYYRFRWLDGSGTVIGANTLWKPVLIYGNQNVIIRDSAPSSNASDYRLELNVE